MSNEIWLGICLFAFVMATVTLAGYLFFLKPRQMSRGAGGLSPASPPSGSPGAVMLDVFQSIGANFPGARKEESPHRRQLQMAGYRHASALPIFYGIKGGGALLAAAIVGMYTVLLGGADVPLVPMLCGMGFGFFAPDRFLTWRVRARMQRLRAALPAALDLMVLGIEAGQSLDYALADASRGLRTTHPELSSELAQLYLELRAGSSRQEAFRNMAERNREPELRKLANLLIDSDRFGSSLGPALRTHSKYLRTRFRQKAQEQARKVAVKLIFPIFFLIFPSVLLVTLGPACLMMMTQLRSMLR